MFLVSEECYKSLFKTSKKSIRSHINCILNQKVNFVFSDMTRLLSLKWSKRLRIIWVINFEGDITTETLVFKNDKITNIDIITTIKEFFI